jgi:hypothetical protein
VLESSPAGVAGPLVPSEPRWLGKYELLHRIGSGGMAELFLARTTSLGGFEKFVALKRVLQRHQGNHELVELLLGEARLAATLQHPNIVQVYDVDEDNGTYFFAMEYVQGKDVREIIRAAARLGKWLPLEHIVNLIIGAAAGLHHAHEQRTADGRPLEIVHRDVSPANILISYDGTPKIVDFGIAKAVTVREGNEETLKGKIPYMSPEQCRGEPLDRRSDVFSLGIVFWELSLGKRLFTGLKGQELVEHIAHSRAPAPSSIRPDFPPDLERIIMRALEPSRDRRYPDARALQLDLEEFARERKLSISAARLAEFMRGLFSIEIAEEAAAIRQYITTTPIGPSPRDRRTQTQTALTPTIQAPLDVPMPTVTPWWQEPKIMLAGVGGLVVLLLIAALFAGGDQPTTTPPRARSGGAVVWEDNIEALQPKPVTLPEQPRQIVIHQPSPEPPPTKPAAPPATAPKKSTKTKTKLPDNWDPNSPLPPP